MNAKSDRDSITGKNIHTGPPPDTTMTPDEYFENFAPIFCTSNVKPCDIGDTMLEHMKQFNVPMNNQRLLVGGLSASKIFISSNLLHWYLTHRVILERVHTIVEYTQKLSTRYISSKIRWS